MILMQQNSNEVYQNIKYLFPHTNNIVSLVNHKAFVPFDNNICDFLNEISKVLMKDTEAKQYPDVITFGFFCRKANIEQIKKTYDGRLNGRLGRGLTFHIAPSNVLEIVVLSVHHQKIFHRLKSSVEYLMKLQIILSLLM